MESEDQLRDEVIRLRQRVLELNTILEGTTSKRAEKLLRIQRDLGVSLDNCESLQQMLTLCVQAAIEASGMDCGGIYVVDPSTEALDLLYHQGLPRDFVELTNHFKKNTSNWHLVMSGRPVYSSFAELGKTMEEHGLKEGLSAIAIVPVRQHRERRIIGCLNLSSHLHDEVPEHSRSTLETIAYQIGDAIANKQAQEALQESEARFRSLVEATSDWIWEIDGNVRYTYVSSRVRETLGYEPAELLGKTPFDFMPEEEAARVSQAFQEIERSERLFERLEKVCLHKDGSTVVIQTSGVPIVDSEGRFCGYRGLDRDITERKKAEAERRKLKNQIQQAQKLESLGVLAGGVAHDFNNILVGIIGHAELAQLAMAPEDPARLNIRQIETAAERATELAGQMLAYSGKGRFIIERMDIQTIIEEMANLLEVSISKRVSMQHDFAADVPPIEADPIQVRQIVMNLIINAAEAMGDEGGVMVLRTGVMECDLNDLNENTLGSELEEGLYSYFEVSDDGCGMDPETVAKIFDPFFTTKFTGRGLGLAAVLGIVRGHHGRIRVQSDPDQGTTFRVLFPSKSGPVVVSESAPRGRAGVDFKGMTVLLVDDEEIVRNVGEKMFEVLGLEVVTAENGVQGLSLFKEEPARFDFIIMDLTMPQMDGEQAFLAMRNIKRDVCVILSSGYDQNKLNSRFFGRGFAGFIQKPYKLITLKNALLSAAKSRDKEIFQALQDNL